MFPKLSRGIFGKDLLSQQIQRLGAELVKWGLPESSKYIKKYSEELYGVYRDSVSLSNE